MPINRDQIRFLIESAKGTRLEFPIAFTAVTGLRPVSKPGSAAG
jgi:hypothetical protein